MLMVHETLPVSGRSWKKVFPSTSDFYFVWFPGCNSYWGGGVCKVCRILCEISDIRLNVLNFQWAQEIPLESFQQVESWIMSSWLTCFKWVPLLYFSVTHRIVTAENSSCPSPDMQKWHCESISTQENHCYYSFYSSNFIYQLDMFWHMLYFAVGQRWHLNAEGSCPCFCFPCDTDSNLWCWGVKVVTFYVKSQIPWVVRTSFDAFSFSFQPLMVHLRMCSLSLYLHRASESPGR